MVSPMADSKGEKERRELTYSLGSDDQESGKIGRRGKRENRESGNSEILKPINEPISLVVPLDPYEPYTIRLHRPMH